MYRKCTACTTTFVSPPPTEADLELMYASCYHDEHYFKQKESRSFLFEMLEQHTPTKKMLDFGCGDGRLIDYAVSRGWTGYGVELDASLVSQLRKRHPGARFGTVRELEESGESQFGVLHLGDVFEHLVEPLEVLRVLTKKLALGGLLFVEGPLEANAHLTRFVLELYFRIRANREGTHPPYHLVFTNRTNQRAALESLGVRTLLYELDTSPWPMPVDRGSVSSLRDAAKYALGQLSVTVSKLIPGWGNRFVFVGALQASTARSLDHTGARLS